MNPVLRIASRPPDERPEERVHLLWDRLADFDASRIDAALTHLLEELCAMVDARNADWIGVVRLSGVMNDDPARGWRPPVVHCLHENEAFARAVREQRRRLEQDNQINEVAARIALASGRFRAARLCDVVGPEWFESEFYRSYYRASGYGDALYVAFPVNEDAESYFGVFRGLDQPRFTPAERDLLAYALRGIKWFHRQMLLSHGLFIAETPLTPVERLVLKQLLGGLTEKQIAAELCQSPNTTHSHVKNIFRKFGTGNRAALMALWLGRTA